MASPSLYQSVPFGNVYPPGNSSANGTIGSVSLYGGYQVTAPSSAWALLQLLSNQDNVNFFLTADQSQVYAHANAQPAPIYGYGQPTTNQGLPNQFYIDLSTLYIWWKDPDINSWLNIAPQNGVGPVPPIYSVPRLQWSVSATANNQTFYSPYLALFNNEESVPSVFHNGVLIDFNDVNLVGPYLTVNRYLFTNDDLEILATANTVPSINPNEYSNANVANYLPIYGGNILANVVVANYFSGDGSNLVNLPINYGNSNVANFLPTFTGNINANYYTGNGAFLTGLPTQYSNSNVANYLVTYTGNISANNISTNGIVGGNANIANDVYIGGSLTVIGNTIFSNSTVVVTTDKQIILANGSTTPFQADQGGIILRGANANILYSQSSNLWEYNTGLRSPAVATDQLLHANQAPWTIGDFGPVYSNANVANYLPTYTGNLTSLNGNIITTANIQATYFIGNGSLLTGFPTTYGNSNVANYLPNYTGNVGGGYYLGNIANAIGYSNITNAIANLNFYSNANVSSWLQSGLQGNIQVASGATIKTNNLTDLTGSNLLYSNTNAISLLGNLTSNIVSTANITAGNFIANGNGIFTNGIFYANGNPYLFQNYSNTNVQSFLQGWNLSFIQIPTVYSNAFTYGNGIQLQGYTNAAVAAYLPNNTSNVSGNYFIGNGSLLTGITATTNYSNANVANYFSSNSNIDITIGTANITTQGNIVGNYFIGNGSLLTGITAGTNYSNANVANYLPTYTGNLVSLTGNITTTANVSASYLLGNIRAATGGYNDSNVAVYLPNYAGNLAGGNLIITGRTTIGANTVIQGNLQVVGNITALNFTDLLIGNILVTLAANATTPSQANGGGIQLNGANANILYNSLSNTWNFSHNLVFPNQYANSNVANYLPGYGGNIAANIIYANTIPATGSFQLNTQYTNIGNASGSVVRIINLGSSANVSISAAGQIGHSSGNLSLTSNANVTGNMYATGNISGNYLLGNIAQATGFANLTGNITTTGNISANYFLGNGAFLTGIAAGSASANGANGYVQYYSSGNFAGNTNFTFDAANANLALTGNLTVSRTASVSGNVTAGANLLVTGYSNITGNLNAGNINGSYSNIANTQLNKFEEVVVAGGSVSGTISPNVAAGTIFTYTLTGNITLNALTNPVAGTSATIILTQDATGNRTLTSTWRFASNVRTLSNTASATDIICVFYSGSQYYASLTKGYV